MRTARSVMATAVILGLAVLPLTLAAQQRQEPEAVVKAALLFLRDTYSLQKMVLDSGTFVPSGRVEEIASAVGALRANGKSMLQCERESVRGQRCLFNADVDGIVSVNDSPRIRG